jgi:hypothetical protein
MIKKKEIKVSALLADILAKEEIKHPLYHGAWIAGGFARAMAHHALIGDGRRQAEYIVDYFIQKDQSGFGGPPDIDIFSFPGNTAYIDFVTKLENKRSYEIFAKNTYVRILSKRDGIAQGVKVQYIIFEDFMHEDIEACFKSFDLVNAQYALYRDDDGKVYVKYTDEALIADTAKLVKVNGVSSPYLGSRILKYQGVKGCTNGLDPESVDLLRAWCYNIITKTWMTPLMGTKRGVPNETYIQKQISRLFVGGVLSESALTIFVNKWRVNISTYNRGGTEFVEHVKQMRRDYEARIQ